MSQQSPHRRVRRKRTFKIPLVSLPLGGHLAFGSLALLLLVVTFSDFGVREMLATAYFAAIIYGAVNLAHGSLREHAPAAPNPPRALPFLTFGASTIALTLYFRHVTGSTPLELSPATATVATGLFLLYVATFLDTITNREHLRRARDPKRPYAGLPRWAPTWRAATLPLAAVIGLAHLGTLGYIGPAALPILLVVAALAHVGSLAIASGRPGA